MSALLDKTGPCECVGHLLRSAELEATDLPWILQVLQRI